MPERDLHGTSSGQGSHSIVAPSIQPRLPADVVCTVLQQTIRDHRPLSPALTEAELQLQVSVQQLTPSAGDWHLRTSLGSGL